MGENFSVRSKKPVEANINLSGVEAQAVVDEDIDDTVETEPPKATQLPVPTGYKLLIALPEAEDKTAGGIVKAAETKHMEEVSSVCGFVLDMGPDAYSGDRFPSGPYCKKGDWIMMRSYSGTRFAVHGKEFRLINDDSVDAVVDDPRGITKR
ncbi:MAG: co-chaperone GroES family protein [Planctomycetota bacterium]|jgi:co-chaperonin GroES (HSP10)